MSARWTIVTPASRVVACQCCGRRTNKLACYRTPTMARACRDCAILDHVTARWESAA